MLSSVVVARGVSTGLSMEFLLRLTLSISLIRMMRRKSECQSGWEGRWRVLRGIERVDDLRSISDNPAQRGVRFIF